MGEAGEERGTQEEDAVVLWCVLLLLGSLYLSAPLSSFFLFNLSPAVGVWFLFVLSLLFSFFFWVGGRSSLRGVGRMVFGLRERMRT